jgi:hypothetical protein
VAADALSRLLPGLLAAAALIASAQAGAQQSVGEAPGADAVRQGCRSVVLVQCAQALRATPPAPADRRRALRQRLDARRLRQIQAQAGLSTIEITSERAATVPSDPWEDFRQSVATAPTPSCFSSDPMPQEQFEPQGLLRLPFLLHAAAVGKCR